MRIIILCPSIQYLFYPHFPYIAGCRNRAISKLTLTSIQLLAYAIAHLGGRAGLSAWRWIFIIEGAATAVIALCAVFLIVDWPEQCRFLNPEELTLLKKRLADDGIDEARMDTLNAYAYKLIFTDWKIWLGSFVYVSQSPDVMI